MRRLALFLVPLCLCPAVSGQAPSYKPLAVLEANGHNARVQKLLFHRGGTELISVSEDKTIRIWDLNTAELVRTIRPPIGPGKSGMLFAAALSPDGKLLAVGGLGTDGGDKPIYVLDLATGAIERTLKGHTGAVNALTFLPSGRYLASCSHDGTARIWNLATGTADRVLEGHTKSVYSLAASPNGKFLVTGSFDHTARIWSTNSGQTLATLKEHKAEVRSVAWSPDGRTIVTASYDRTIMLWDADGTARHRFAELGNQVTSVCFTPDGTELLYTQGGTAGDKFECLLLNVETGRIRQRFTRHNNTVHDGAVSPNGRLAATTGGDDLDIYVWRTHDGTALRRLAGSGKGSWAAAWSPDGKAIAWGNTRSGSTIRANLPLERTFHLTNLEFGPAPETEFQRAQLTKGNLRLEVGEVGQLLVKQGQQTVTTMKLGDPYEDIRSCTFLPNNQVAIGGDFGLHLFDQTTGLEIKELMGHTGTVTAVAPSPDGRFLLSASNDQTLKIWNLRNQTLLMTIFFAQDDWIVWNPDGYYASSPDGERLMGWYEASGPDVMGRYIPAVNCRKSLLREDLVRQLVVAGSADGALASADAAKGKKSPKLNVATVLPPKVAITHPSRTGAQFPGPTIEVQATAKSVNQHPVVALRLLVDGRPYEGAAGIRKITPPQAEASASWTVELTSGRHRLAVQAESALSQTTSELVDVTIGDASSPDAGARPSLYVLAIGISAYPGELKLDYAHRDAEAIAATFTEKSRNLFGKVETRLLTDEKATRNGILDGLEWLKQSATQRDVAVVFYAGHAAKDNQNALFMIPVDGDPQKLFSTCVSGDNMKKALADMPCRVLALLDACHTGAIGGDKRRSAASTDDFARDLVTDDYGVMVMCASTGREVSMESSSVKHGYFTLALVEGLSGKCDYNRDGHVYSTELDNYVTDRVKELTKGKQHPVTTKPTTIRSFPLTRLQ
jgi:WD40 repeat protein